MIMKVIAFYLPQFHETAENNRWWGNGFTEWTNLKRSAPLFPTHNQPRVPLNKNYYDLSNVDVLRWQIDLAKRYGIYGFCVYHYWFEEKLLLQNPMESYLSHTELEFPFCFCWANESWTKSWDVTSKNDILVNQTYGNERIWKSHFEYLYQFFQDERYIRIGKRPLFVIYRPELIPHLKEMILLWNALAIKNGLEGICFASQQRFYNIAAEENGKLFDFQIEYQPAFVRNKLYEYLIKRNSVACINYDDVWREVLQSPPLNEKSIPGAFVDWDNTPRKLKNGVVFTGATPQKFQEHFTQQLKRAESVYKKDMIFLFAWNEWSEGGYLEPDEKVGYGYLEAVKTAISTYTRRAE